MNRRLMRDRARSMRNQPTDAEYRLWYAVGIFLCPAAVVKSRGKAASDRAFQDGRGSHLRCRQLDGIKFRRQAPIGTYIVDFVSFERKIVIELDGGQHTGQAQYDSERTRWLQSQGFRVFRFWNFEALEDMEAVLETIWQAIKEPEYEQTERGSRCD